MDVVAACAGLISRGHGIAVVHQPSKLTSRVRLPVPAPRYYGSYWTVGRAAEGTCL